MLKGFIFAFFLRRIIQLIKLALFRIYSFYKQYLLYIHYCHCVIVRIDMEEDAFFNPFSD